MLFSLFHRLWNIIDIAADKNYLEQETKFLINGGEVCNDDPVYTNCTNAQNELKKLHFTFLNNDYNIAVLNRWNMEGCSQTIKNKLGYRLELMNGTYTDAGRVGYTYNVSLNLRNSGYAPPYDKKQIQLILKNNSTAAYFPLTIANADSRYWLPDSIFNINVSAGIGNLPEGSYNLYLALKDTGTNISGNAKYSVQFANEGIWDAEAGYNLIKSSINIYNTSATGTSPYSGSVWFGNPNLPLPAIYTFTGNGNWNAASNWSNGIMPPASLSNIDEIIIDPVASGQCILNIPYTVSAGAKLTVMPTKKFLVQGNLTLLK